MYLTHVALDDFRSYHSEVVMLQPGINVFLGANGQGKTNLVEAIGYLTHFHSHRVGRDQSLVRYAPQSLALQSQVMAAGDVEAGMSAAPLQGAPTAATIRVKGQKNGREILVDLEIIAGKANRARLARQSAAPKEVKGLIRTVLFAPENLEIIRSEPGVRRRFLDDILVQIEPIQSAHLADHTRLLAQRAALLKAASKKRRAGQNLSSELATLEIFNQQLSAVAAQIIAGRNRLVAALSPHVAAAYEGILGTQHRANSSSRLTMQYLPSYPATPAQLLDQNALQLILLDTYANSQNEEIARGVNLHGAHRDDLLLKLDELPIKGFASHGETWSATLSLKLGEYALLSEDGDLPILILDDVFSELDSSRRTSLLDLAKTADQTLITVASESDIPPELNGTLYRVKRGAEGTKISPAQAFGTPEELQATDEATQAATDEPQRAVSRPITDPSGAETGL